MYPFSKCTFEREGEPGAYWANHFSDRGVRNGEACINLLEACSRQ